MAAVAVLLAAGAGCVGGGEAERLWSGSYGPCTRDADCVTGLKCDLSASLCLARAGQTELLSVLLTPTDGREALIEEQYVGIQAGDDGVLNLLMHRPLRLVGRVYLQGGLPVTADKVRVVAVSEGDIPGKDYHHDASYPTDEAGRFDLLIQNGRTYDIYIQLWEEEAGAPVPPYHLRRSFLPDWGAADPYELKWEIQLPASDGYRIVKGVVYGSSVLKDPLPGAMVFAYSEGSGAMSNSPRCGEDGSFELLLPSGPDGDGRDDWRIHVQSPDSSPLVWEFTSTETFDLTRLTDALVLSIGDAAKQASVTIEPNPLFAGTTGDANAMVSVFLEGRLASGILRMEGQFYADEDWLLPLPPGSYAGALLPAATSVHGLTSFGFDLGEDDLVFKVSPQLKAQVMGRVLAPDGRPVPDAKVTAVYLRPLDNALPLPEHRFETRSDGYALYELWLDPGLYLLYVDPPDDMALPRLILEGVTVDMNQTRDLQLPLPALIRGRIEAAASQGGVEPAAPNGNGAAGISSVRIEVFSAGSAGGKGTCALSQTWSGEDGSYALLIPFRPVQNAD